jgi:hypothetical protein
MESPKQRIARRPARCRRARSSLVRRLLQAKDDPAKQRIRRWLSDIDDKRLSREDSVPEPLGRDHVNRPAACRNCMGGA